MLSAFFAVFFSLWLVGSCINQFDIRAWKRLVVKYDRYFLMPRWTFFAPHPGCTDYHLLYRDFNEQETPGAWTEIGIVRKRKLLDFFWNPDKRACKALFDLTHSVNLVRKETDNDAVLKTSIPYITVAHYIAHLEQQQDTQYRQFLIAQSHGFYTSKTPDLLIRSEMYRVTR